jgi:hypothetical protein
MNNIINRLVKRILIKLSNYKDKQEKNSYLEGIRLSFNKLVNKKELTKEQKKEIQDFYSNLLGYHIPLDYHKYFTFHCFDSSQISTCYTFLGLAIEIEAKEDLLHSQSEDYLTINLNDRFRNFDRIEVVYGDNKEIEWQYDDLKAVYDTEGIFNLTKDDDERCLVYGLKNTDGKSTEYRFTCLESCKIISITGYRE